MHRKMIRWVAASCFALSLSACGPAEPQEETAPMVEEVEQGIGSTPLCISTSTVQGYIDSKTVWASACGTCATYAGGGFGLPGSYYERCCQRDLIEGGTTCGAWKYIKPVCSTCSPD